MATEDPANSALLMDRGVPIGNSVDRDSRRAIHVKIKNTDADTIPLPTGAATASNQVIEQNKLDTLHADLVTIEGKQDTGNTSLNSIDSKLTSTNTKLDTLHTDLSSTIHTDLATTLHGDITSTNTKLDTLHTDLVVIEGKQDTGNTSLASIDTKLTSTNTKLDTLHTDLVTVEGKQDTGNTSLASIDSKVSTAANQATQITSLQLIDDIPHAQNAALSKGVPSMGQLDDTGTVVATEDNVSVVRVTAQRAFHVNPRNNSGVEIGTSSNPINVAPIDGAKATYRAASAASFASAATATDIATITGSGTKTIRVTRILLTGIQTTAAEIQLFILKRSTANTAGTSTTLTNVPMDSAFAAATATVRQYTANPTTGTLVGNIDSYRFALPVAAIGGNAAPAPLNEITFGTGPYSAVVLRGTNDVLALNLGGVTISGGSFLVRFEWTEE